MAYHINAEVISLEELRNRIETTDLVPSRVALLKNLDKKLNKIKEQGISNLADLRNAIKTPKKIESFAQTTGIENDYLILLRREINSYFPKPFPLKSFDWLPQTVINNLEKKGIKNTVQFYENFLEPETRENLKRSLGIKEDVFHQISCCCDLVRMQWTSPLAARMFLDAGYDSVQTIKSADPNVFCDAVAEVNKGDKYFKGKIGLRDIKRLIDSANYL